MTAQRWWVRLFARWKAKVGAVQADVGLFFNLVRTVAIVSGLMTFFSWPTWSIVVLMGGMISLVATYAHLYSEGGVWNQTQRDVQDMSSNYSRPVMRIDDEMIARTMLAGLEGEPLSESQRDAIKAEADETFEEYSDGLDLTKFDR